MSLNKEIFTRYEKTYDPHVWITPEIWVASWPGWSTGTYPIGSINRIPLIRGIALTSILNNDRHTTIGPVSEGIRYTYVTRLDTGKTIYMTSVNTSEDSSGNTYWTEIYGVGNLFSASDVGKRIPINFDPAPTGYK